MSKVAKWIFPAAGGKDGIVGTAKAVVGFLTGNAGLVMDGVRQVAGAGRKGDAQARQASVLNLQLGEVPRQAVIGIACTAGSLVDVFSFGGQYGTDKVTRCVALADHAIDGIEGFYINEVYYPWVGEGLQAAFGNKLSFHFRQATVDGHEPPAHVMANGGWPATDRLVGLTVMWIDWYVDDKIWPQGHPAIRFVLRGLRVYDPRFDPQYGYTGPNPQTWTDRSSHRFSRNAKVLRYAYTRGIFVEGRQGQPEHLLIGRGLSEEESPGDLVIPDANLCDEIVDGVARYTANGVISASQPFIEVDGMFAAAMAGVIVQREGTVDVEAGQAKAVVATFTDADLVIGEKVGFSRFLGDNDGGRLNTFIGRYIEPLLGWKDHSAPVRRSQADIQADGGPRESTVSLSLVTEVKQADRIVEINRLLSRLERRGNVVLPPRFAGLEEGDWVAWQSARRHKGATVRYRIEAYREPETWRKYLTLREIASSVFGVPDPVDDFTAPPPPPVVIDALALAGVTAEAITLPGSTSAVPAIRFRWTAPVDAAVLAIRAEVRRVDEAESAPTRTEEVNDGVMIATNGVGPDQLMQARLVPIGDPSRPVLPSNWITVSTSSVIAGGIGSERAAEVVAAVKQLRDVGQGVVANAFTLLNETLEDLAEGVLDNTSENENLNRWINQVAWIDGEKVGTYAVRRTTALDDGLTLAVQDIVALGARTDAAFAGYEAEINLVIDGLNAEVEARTVFQAETETSFGGVLDTLSVMAGDLDAEIQQRETLAVTVGENQSAALSSINLVADDLSAEVEARTVFQAETETSFGGVLDTLSVMAGDLDAEIQQRETLAVTVGENQSAALSSINLVADDLSAEVEARTVFQAETETSVAGVLDTLSVLATDLSAEIQQRETLAVIVEDNQAAALSSISLVTDALGVEAERIDGLLISSGENAAAIVTERDARLSDIAGLVSEITALSLDFDGQQASITLLNELTGDLESGLNAVIGLVLDVDGYAVGVRAANDGTTGSLKLLFDTLDFVDPDGGDPISVISYGLDNVLTLQDVVIRNAAVIGDLTVRGEAIVRDVVTPLTATYAAASISLNGRTRTTVAEVVVATTGKQLNIRFNGLIDTRHEPASSYTLFVELRRQTATGVGDLQIDYGSVDAPGNTADNIVAKWPIDVLDRPTAGTYRYYVDVWTSSTNMTVQAVRQRFMSAMELRTNS